MARVMFKTVQLADGTTTCIDFNAKVISASAAIQGYELCYPDEAHYVKRISVNTSVEGINENKVIVSARCMMEDGSSNIGQGSILVQIIAECDC
ncbi:hypothetical protein [Anaeromicropila populeti]|uniref:Uncharacterized protein n=1 Tax=Anaeromicropila populeti TaxID=37658 RepID=A0A1I6IMB4_9FIRM|nr:hypothetical protein [Anaeromicropila populeti]SFR67801.1 hypothetical protein SAMN05661086_00893 [Anaeromicropila populeti]